MSAKSRTSLIVLGLAAVLLAVYIPAFLNISAFVLNAFGLLSVLVLLLSPVVIAVGTAMETTHTLKYSTQTKPAKHYVSLGLQRYRWLILVGAALLPVFVVWCLYVALDLAVIFSSIESVCPGGPCSRTATQSPDLFLPVAALFLFGVQCWGTNFLAATLGAGLACWRPQYGWLAFGAGAIVVVFMLIDAAIVFSASVQTQFLTSLVGVALPYLLVGGLMLSFQKRAREVSA